MYYWVSLTNSSFTFPQSRGLYNHNHAIVTGVSLALTVRGKWGRCGRARAGEESGDGTNKERDRKSVV
jgi:hypothetical protein